MNGIPRKPWGDDNTIPKLEADLIKGLADEWLMNLHRDRPKAASRLEARLHAVLKEHYPGRMFVIGGVVFRVTPATPFGRVDWHDPIEL